MQDEQLPLPGWQQTPQSPMPERTPSMTTADLTSAILKYIRGRGGYAVRINCYGVYDAGTGRWRKSATDRGTADIHACFNGWHLSIEIKTGSDRQRRQQQQCGQDVTKAGGCYWVVRTFADFHAQFEQVRTRTHPAALPA